MWFTVLGAVAAYPDRWATVPITLSQPSVRRLLAMLASDPGRIVQVSTLIDGLWPEAPPVNAVKAVQVYAYRLRRVIGADRVLRRPGGYVLVAEPAEVDASTLAELVRSADAALHSDDPRAAREFLDEALGLWRGMPFADCSELEVLRPEVSRLSELRLRALELRATLVLDEGAAAAVVPELNGLVTAHPYREGLRELLMLALYRSGRQAEALEHYRATREAFAEALGVEPGEGLRRLHERILRNDPELGVVSATGGSGDRTSTLVPGDVRGEQADSVRPAQLPSALDTFTGRSDDLLQLVESPSRVTVVDGMAGVGKTALVVQAAHAMADRFPDGQLFVDLHGFTEGVRPDDPAEVLDRMLRATGVPAERIPAEPQDRASLWRSRLAEQRMLLVLDNAASEPQVLPLLPGAAGCRTLITSRQRLPGLDDARMLSLGTLSEPAAVRLFRTVASPGSETRESDGSREPKESGKVVAEIVGMCGRLPLAVRLAAARLRARPGWNAADLARRLRDEHTRLGELKAGGRSVRGAFQVSYEQLEPMHQRVFRLIGLHPGPDLDAYAAAALTEVELADAERVLEELVDQHLLESTAYGRYSFHDLLRSYAIEKARAEQTAAERAAALVRLYDFELRAVTDAVLCFAPYQRQRWRLEPDPASSAAAVPRFEDRSDGIAWLDSERTNLVALARRLPPGTERQVSDLAIRVHPYLDMAAGYADSTMIHRQALVAARRLGSAWHEARVLNGLGGSLLGLGAGEEAESYFRQAAEVASAAGDVGVAAAATINLSNALSAAGRLTEALRAGRRAVELCSSDTDDRRMVLALDHLGKALAYLDRVPEAEQAVARALRLARTLGDSHIEGEVLNRAGSVANLAGRYAEAFEHCETAARMLRSSGPLWAVSRALAHAGDALHAMGRISEALSWHAEAVRLGHRADRRAILPEGLCGLGETLTTAGRADEALGHLNTALTIAEEDELPMDQARANTALGLAYAALDRPGDAVSHLRRAYQIYRNLQTPRAERVAALLARLGEDVDAGQPAGATGTFEGGAKSDSE